MMNLCDEKLNCKCETYSEYEIKLKCAKTKLHSKYIASISIGIVIWLLATGQANTEQFSEWISFASTIASIILSVIAIILSITGESKTESMRDKIEEYVKRLEKNVSDIETANKQSIENVNCLRRDMKELQDVLDNIPDATMEKIVARYTISKKDADNTENIDKGWIE